MKKFNTYCILIIGALISSCSQNKKVQNHSTKYFCGCSLLTAENSKYWLIDSTGTTGFRTILTKSVLEKCKLTKSKWSDAEKFFGQPQLKKHSDENQSVFQYKVKNLDPRFTNFNDPGNWILNFRIAELDTSITKIYLSFGE